MYYAIFRKFQNCLFFILTISDQIFNNFDHMQKLFERIGTETQKFKFNLIVNKIRTTCSTKETYRIVLKREGKVFTSSTFKVEPKKDNEIRQSIKFTATVYYDRKAQEYQDKIFQLLVLRKNKEKQIQESNFQIHIEDVVDRREYKKVLEDRVTRLQITILGEGPESLSPIRKSYPQTNIQNLSYNQKKDERADFNQTAKRSTIELIKFGDDAVQKQVPMSPPFGVIGNNLISTSKEKYSSFRNISMKDDDRRSDSQINHRNRMRKRSRQIQNKEVSNNSTNVQDKLSMIQNQLGEQRLRKSTLYENINHEKDEIISKLKLQNSQLQMSLNKYINQLEFSNKQIKNIQGRYEYLYKKFHKIVEQQRQIKDQRDRLVNQNAQLSSALALLKGNRGGEKQRAQQTNNRQGLEIQKIKKQIQNLKKQNRSYEKQIQSCEAERASLQNRYQDIVKKYKNTCNQLSSQRAQKEEQQKKRQLQQRQFHKELKQKQESIMELKRQIKQFELKSLKPDDELSKKEHALLKQRLEKIMIKIEEDGQQNRELEIFLRKELEKHKAQNNILMEQLSNIQKSYADEMNISINKQKSLNKLLQQKDKKIAEQGRELDKVRFKLVENNKFIETEKVQLIKKMTILTEELSRRKQMSEELQITEQKARQLQNKLKMLNSQKELEVLEIQKLKQQNSSLIAKSKEQDSTMSYNLQLQLQLIRVKKQIAAIMQVVLQKAPKLVEEITQSIKQV